MSIFPRFIHRDEDNINLDIQFAEMAYNSGASYLMGVKLFARTEATTLK